MFDRTLCRIENRIGSVKKLRERLEEMHKSSSVSPSNPTLMLKECRMGSGWLEGSPRFPILVDELFSPTCLAGGRAVRRLRQLLGVDYAIPPKP